MILLKASTNAAGDVVKCCTSPLLLRGRRAGWRTWRRPVSLGIRVKRGLTAFAFGLHAACIVAVGRLLGGAGGGCRIVRPILVSLPLRPVNEPLLSAWRWR